VGSAGTDRGAPPNALKSEATAVALKLCRLGTVTSGVASTQERQGLWGWIILVAALLVGLTIAANSEDAPTPAQHHVVEGPGLLPANGGTSNAGYDGLDTGYENPALGDDGSSDCPPGGGAVYVGSSDPAGLDGDGDGIGCE
jgi:hypothetical protein